MDNNFRIFVKRDMSVVLLVVIISRYRLYLGGVGLGLVGFLEKVVKVVAVLHTFLCYNATKIIWRAETAEREYSDCLSSHITPNTSDFM
jgi:hypothetical protein